MTMNEYRKVLDILGTDRICNHCEGYTVGFRSDARIDVDNSARKATELVESILSYADAMLFEVDALEPSCVSDVMSFTWNDERYVLDMDHMLCDACEAEWENWKDVRREILAAGRLHVEYSYETDAEEAGELIGCGIQGMLEKLLADGQLADCVKLSMRIETVHGGFEFDDGLASEPCRLLWMNGTHNGSYVCGEVPYERNDALIRSYGAWRQSECSDGMEENGIILRLHPRTSPALLNRLRRSAKQFASKVNCNMEYFLSREEHRRAYAEENSSYMTASMTDKALDDAEQRNLPDLRIYFTKEEVEALLNRYPKLSALYVRHAGADYTADDLERIRFMWTLVLMEQLEGPSRSVRHGNWFFPFSQPSEEYMKVFERLPEEIRFRLYGGRNYEASIDDMSGQRVYRFSDGDRFKGFINTHSGLGDLSIQDDHVNRSIHENGYFIRLNLVYLNGMEDIREMCRFLNELKEIEQLAQAETGLPIQKDDTASVEPGFSIDPVFFTWNEEEEGLVGAELENLDRISKQTRREFHEQLSQQDPVGMNQLTVCDGTDIRDNVTFEAEDKSQWAHLNFRLEQGKFICEIAHVED